MEYIPVYGLRSTLIKIVKLKYSAGPTTQTANANAKELNEQSDMAHAKTTKGVMPHMPEACSLQDFSADSWEGYQGQ